MEGHVRKRSGKWYYSFEASNVDGKRKRIERVGGRTKKEAEAALRDALQKYNNAGLHFEPTDVSVADYMDYWHEHYVMVNCAYNTQIGYRGIIDNHIKPALGIYKLKSLTPTILQGFANDKFLDGLSQNFLTGVLAVISGSLKYAVQPCQFLNSNPMQYVKYPKYEHSRKDTSKKFISAKDFDEIIKRFPFPSSFYIPIMIGYHTGCRIGEVMSLTWDDINLDERTIDINTSLVKRNKNWYFGNTKTESSMRTIMFGKTLEDALRKQRKWQLENKLSYGQYYTQQYEVEEVDPKTKKKIRRIHSLQKSIDAGDILPVHMVCTKENGEMITSESFRYASKVIHYQLNIVFNFHSLRHTHATMLIENGASIKDVQTRLGHSKMSTTMDTYAHATKKMAEQSVDIFERALNVSLPTK